MATPQITSPAESRKTPSVSGYADIKLIPFLVAAGVVALPIAYLKTTNQNQWVWKYILLIVLSLVIYYQQGISRFAQFMTDIQKQI